MKKEELKKIAQTFMKASVKQTKEKAEDFLGLFDLGADEGDDIETMLNKITKGMRRQSAREAINKAIEYSDRVELEPADENYIIEQLEKYLE